MIKSMTAYAEKTAERNGLTISCEIRSYNSRYLDIALRLPRQYRPFEHSLKQLVSERVSRGRVELSVAVVAEEKPSSCRFTVDQAKADDYYQALLKLQQGLGLEDPIPLSMLAHAEGVITLVEPETSAADDGDCLAAAVENALAELDDMRRKEGGLLAADIKKRINEIKTTVAWVKSQSANLAEEVYLRLKERITALTRDMVELDQGRIAQEAALFADKADISEEIVRAESHLVQFLAAMADEEPCGRKLSFLLQEFNREFNTMGSKTGKPEISEQVVAAKTELEKIREQVQNIE